MLAGLPEQSFTMCELMQNQFDSLDLSDNVIVRLEGFPKLPRLKTLLLSNNRVMRISRNLEGKLLAAPLSAAVTT